MRRRDLLTGATAVAGVAAVGAPGVARADTGGGNSRDRAVRSRIDTGRALRDLRYLSEEIGWRISGTESEHRAARYIADQARRAGYQVTLQPFSTVDKTLAELRVPGADRWQAVASANGRLDVSVRGRVVDAGNGGEADYPADVSGKVVLVERGLAGSDDPTSAKRVDLAVRRGAIAVLLTNVSTVAGRKAGTFNPNLGTGVSVPVPVVGIAQYHAEQIRRLRSRDEEIRLSTKLYAGLTSYNVIAERQASRPNPDGRTVMISAHYDSVPGAPGANDDGSGTVLCLELARALRRLPTSTAVRFAWWGSEEYGLIGSTHYVSQLDDAAASRIVGCFQNDMVGTSWDLAVVYWLLSVDGLDNTCTKAVAEAAARIGYASEVQGPVARGSSDHVPFHERGIAAANHSWRGAGGPAELEPLYHTPEDTIEQNVSRTRLRKSIELIGCAAYDLAAP